MKRKMGIDYGRSRIGIAVSDTLGITARGIETISWDGVKSDYFYGRIKALCREYEVDKIIVGLPRRTDGKPGEMEDEVRKFASHLEKTTCTEVILRDERYTTSIANRIMNETGVKGSKKKKRVDALAAEVILQDYLDYCMN